MLEKIYAIISAIKTMNNVSGTMKIYVKNDTKYTDYTFECDTKTLIDLFGRVHGLMHYSFYEGTKGYLQITVSPDFLYNFAISYNFLNCDTDINEQITIAFYNKEDL